ncbi:Hypothetical protein I596_3277 [Dokdonella koreensis DS-123]|uniref:Uncharacterized protein n=1 Tax=Dokdonella koreensis DS-123 TaxID=1300342 RepID=A0A167H758_9GAMM|nr:Hypothetical protein I596_3277 [Dokdonella koreensis DS-123]
MPTGIRRRAAPASRPGGGVSAITRGTWRCIAFFVAAIAALPAPAAEPASVRDFDNPQVGRIQLQVPPDWLAYERQDGAGTTFVRLLPPDSRRFGLEIQVNTRERLGLPALTVDGLPGYLVSRLSGLLPRFLETAVAPVRFGPAGDGAYARLTDRHPRQGEFLFLTRGVRLDGEAVIVFTLYSSDHDASVLTPVLAVAASVTIVRPVSAGR